MTSCFMPAVRDGRTAESDPATSDRPSHPVHRLVRFAGIGGAATVVQLGLFAALLTIVPQTWANLFSWTVSTVIANSAHRSVTFGIHGSAHLQRDFLASAAFSLLSLGAGVVALARLSTDNPVLSVVVLIAVNAVVGLARYAGLSWWFTARAA
jgi:putative flippase GtrA